MAAQGDDQTQVDRLLCRQHTLLSAPWMDQFRNTTTTAATATTASPPHQAPGCAATVSFHLVFQGRASCYSLPLDSFHRPGLRESRKRHYEQEASPQEEGQTGECATCPVLLPTHRCEEGLPRDPPSPVGQGGLWGRPRGEWGRALLGSVQNLSFLLGLMQALGAFVTYFTVYAQQGFLPSTILNLRVEWENDNVNDLEDSYGQEWVRTRLLAASSLDGCQGTGEVMVFLVNRAWGPCGHSSLPLPGSAHLSSWRSRAHLFTLACIPGGSDGKESAFNEGDLGLIPENPLEKGTATHSSILTW